MRKNLYPYLFSLGLALTPALTSAQNNAAGSYRLLFQNGAFTPAANANALKTTQASAPSETANGYYFRLVQFWQIPTEVQKAEIKRHGIELHQYMPHNAYLASVPVTLNAGVFAQLGIRALVQLEAAHKLSPALLTGQYPQWALRPNNQLEVVVQYFPTLSAEQAQNLLSRAGAQIVGNYAFSQLVTVRVPVTKLSELAALPFLISVEPVDADPYEDNLVGKTDHRSNAISTDHPMGRQYNGEGVVIAMGDGGKINYHIDYQGRYSVSATQAVSDHSEHVAGTIMGAGNRDPKARGMAHGAELISYYYGNAIGSLPGSYTANNVRVTSNSWSSGGQCNSTYNGSARTGDQQIRQMPSLMHVFSAGNTGADNCSYGAGAGWGNINGGYKQGKNVLAVANLSYTDGVSSSSSRGPARDGRVKPDISGVGSNVYSSVSPQTYTTMSGTSMSTPGVAGTWAQLYQAYEELNSGTEPPSALLKAVILNTADDLGNPGPDFKYGYGRINALRAVKALEQGTYIEGTATQGSANNHTITVPAGTQQVRVMVYWADYEAAVNASVALVNNLNMEVSDPTGTTFQPWILNPAPNPAILDLPATRGADDLNNVEQVTLETPTPGTYTVSVSGAAVPQGPQTYYLVYTLVQDEIELTYPVGGEAIAPAFQETIRWDAYGTTGNFHLEYSLDSGATWTTISSSVAGALRHYNWIVPSSLVSGQALVRVSRGTLADVSDAVFTIIKVPAALSVAYICPDSLKLQWNPVSGAIAYEVSRLGQKYMDSVATTTATSVVLHGIDPAQPDWFSVKAIAPNNGKGRRALALEKPAGMLNCAQDAAITAITSPVSGCFTGTNTQVCVTVENPGASPINNIQVGLSVDSGMPVMLTIPGTLAVGASMNYCFDPSLLNISASGPVQISASAVLPGDVELSNNQFSIMPVLVIPPVAAITNSNNGLQHTFSANPTGMAGYSWSFGDGNTSSLENPTHTYAAAGTYTVSLTVTDASGCTNTTTQTVSAISGLFTEVSQHLSVHPNPTSGEVLLEWPIAAAEMQLEVFNMLGQTLHRETATQNQHRLQLNHLPQGTYVVKLTGNNQTAVARLVLQR